jgi:hypothetical protein
MMAADLHGPETEAAVVGSARRKTAADRPRYRHLRHRYIHWRRLHDLALAELDAILAEILAEPESGR